MPASGRGVELRGRLDRIDTRESGEVEILEGLNEGDRVVIEGAGLLSQVR